MKFLDFGFKKFLNDALSDINFIEPTRIQEMAIPILKRYGSVVGQAHTGTGKTHAFLLPSINNLDLKQDDKVQLVIITPTRELARQIFENTKELLKYQTEFTCSLLIGGDDINRQSENLKNKQPNIVIGTPTRIKELYEKQFLMVTTASQFIIDECDMIFDLGFIDEVDFILSRCAKDTRISVFSATIKNELKPFLKKYIRNAVFINVTDDKPTNKNIEHILIWTKNKENQQVLETIVKNINPFLVIIFVNRKDQVKDVIQWLTNFGIKNVGELHGDLDPRTRANMQKRIQNKEFTYLVATDVAARGIDIDGVSHIISIDLPTELDYYIHRSGRTGRNNYKGQSFVLFNNGNQNQIDRLKQKKIEFTNMKLEKDYLVLITTKKRVPKKNDHQSKTEIEIKRVSGKFKNQKVKPNYKKRKKEAIEKVKKDVRRQHIKESIKKIKKEKYKTHREKFFEDD